MAGHAVTLDTHSKLNFASAIPLSFILKKNPQVRLVAIAPPQNVSAKTLYEFGRATQEVLMQSSKNIVVLAAGDGSHALNAKSPNAATKQGAQFDEYLQHILVNRNASSILNLDPELVQAASQSIYAQICILFGIMHGIQTKYTTHSYEAPFGVGYFVASYQ
jgi:aromatic ring-opening dioxygenase LigB subunit